MVPVAVAAEAVCGCWVCCCGCWVPAAAGWGSGSGAGVRMPARSIHVTSLKSDCLVSYTALIQGLEMTMLKLPEPGGSRGHGGRGGGCVDRQRLDGVAIGHLDGVRRLCDGDRPVCAGAVKGGSKTSGPLTPFLASRRSYRCSNTLPGPCRAACPTLRAQLVQYRLTKTGRAVIQLMHS